MALDPAQNVHEQLLPHIHLVSTFRYPHMARLDMQEVTKWLIAAPKIALHQAPFFWTYIDAPKDGAILLTWQPLTRLGTDFASDGYVWPGPEVVYQHDIGNGLVLEIYYHRVGYRPGEQFALHTRRRFRLVPGKGAGPNAAAQLDMSLWIVHYGPADTNDRIPVQMLPVDARQQAILQYRMQLQRAGQIVRKEFMLSDRVNWPQIPLPREGRVQAVYAGQGNVRGVPQQMAYPPHPGAQHPPSKRTRHPAPGSVPPPGAMGMAPPMDPGFDDDEDTSKGDLFDHLTPREVSLDRYKQNHEWMEEVLSSVYRMDQIIPADLGLGLKGDLAPLTDGIFEAQAGGALTEEPKKRYIGRLDKRLADEFRKRVAERVETTNSEIEAMKAEHAKTVAKFKSLSAVRHAEQDLRLAVADSGPEFWRLEGRVEDGDDGSGRWANKHNKSLDAIVGQVETTLGKHVAAIDEVRRTQDGGYQEPEPELEPEPEPEPVVEPEPEPEPTADITARPDAMVAGPTSPASRQPSHADTPHSGVMVGDSDIDMGGTAAGLLDQMHTGFSNTSTPINSFPTPQPQLSAIPSAAPTPAHIAAPSPQAMTASAAAPTDESKAAEDVAMEDVDTAGTGMDTAPDHGTDSGDWVLVPKGGVSAPSPKAAAAPGTTGDLAAAAMSADAAPAVATSAATDAKPVSAAPTPADGAAADVDNNDFSDLASLGDGAADLENYDPPTLGETPVGDLGLEMEDSAFGNAFHGVEHEHSGGGDTDGGL